MEIGAKLEMKRYLSWVVRLTLQSSADVHASIAGSCPGWGALAVALAPHKGLDLFSIRYGH